ncbi:MAG: MaoC family dehydratase N-terminal domain-containing protein [Betaproteobacteria bacterium]|jgi:3-methylfumaryl-CoA hydratase
MNLTDWIGRTEALADVIAPTPFAALSATLGRPDVVRPADGAVLPPLWHWLYFLPLYPKALVGPDGHAQRGGFLPPVALPRRMWAGSQLEFLSELKVGEQVQRLSTIEDVTQKSGKSGTLVFVKVRHETSRLLDGEVVIREWQDIVYREPAVSQAPAPAPQAAPQALAWQHQWVPDEVMLFRYSALTFNGHRIHYDHPYVTQVEGYPGLVVHGPLMATLLLELVAQCAPQARVEAFEFRAMRPTFANRALFCCGQPDDAGRQVDLWVRDEQGAVIMQAKATLGSAP